MRHRHTRWPWIAGVLVFGLLTTVLVVSAIMADRRAALRGTEERTISMARLLMAHAESAMEDANKIILAVEPLVLAWDLDEPVQGSVIFNRLRELIPGSPQIASAWTSPVSSEISA